MIFDREKARQVLRYARNLPLADDEPLLDRLAGCVTSDPAQAIDRDALVRDAMGAFYEHDGDEDREGAEMLVDRMLLHGVYLTQAPPREVIAAAIQTDFDVRTTSALRVADAILALLRPDPAQTIDRDSLIEVVDRIAYEAQNGAPRNNHLAADRILALLRPDPRIAAIEALCEEADESLTLGGQTYACVRTSRVRAILRGEP